MTFVYTVNLGFSPAGGSVHPVDELGSLPSLDAAKAAAEQETGKPLQWRWMEDRQCWRAEVDHDRAAEIWKGTVLERIDAGAGIMT
ncbi:hypothetical protein [Arthrobacter sp. ISL-65]|uniref:hypothetical protein n=1 Tax=Arthrobacter sp. ISL-65 TaxID=2819112 RepID=UPI001BEA034F|nr:hypothetical protein [Arthrobacter sp. ISL-65]MBT2550978.1 hypothetical protein [Arthrobacter sp. ISL-65]